MSTNATMPFNPKYSVIFLLEEKSDRFAEFVASLYDLFAACREPFEMIIMANGTEGFLRNELKRVAVGRYPVKAFALNKKTPQAVCLHAAFQESRGEILVVCGSYQQLTLDSFPVLLDALDEGTDIVSPWRRQRVDPSFNQLQSRVFNVLVRWAIGSTLHDLSCTVKVLRREVLENTQLYGNMYRFLPILAQGKGFRNREVPCGHHQERGKTGFYSGSEYLSRILDIFTLYFNSSFSRKPLRFFSAIGLLFITIGMLIVGFIFVEKIVFGVPVGERNLLLMAILCMVSGIQAASVGLLGEIVAFTHGRLHKEYTVETEI